ncbi:9846_t:CDS:2, partial [Cetraspora pellucida]
MPKGSPRKNMGPCAVCGKDDLGEKFRKLTPKLLSKAMQSEAASNLKIQLKLDDQLCHKHYNIQSTRGQDNRLFTFGKDSEKGLSELFTRHQLITENEQPIFHVYNIQLVNFDHEIINLNYQPFNKKIELSKLDAILIREHHVAARRIEITDLINKAVNIITFNVGSNINSQPRIQGEGAVFDQCEIENGVYRSIRSILTILLPIWKQSSPPILIPGDTIKLKLGGNGRNVGRKQNHVMMTICLLNEGRKVLEPNNQYCICLYVGYEKYDVLANIGRIFEDELFDLKNNGFFDSDG